MNVLDLFSGIGGFSLGLERAGMRTVAFCEIDPYCRAVLRRHWPDVPIFEDVRTISSADVGPVDVVCGGFPCQPFSSAARGRNTMDGYLWPEMLRVVAEVGPTWVCAENVVHLERVALEQVCADLEGCGYEVQTLEIPACAVDADHIRRRLWILGYSDRNGKSSGPIHAKAPWVSRGGGNAGSVGNAYGIPKRMDRLRALGNAVVPQIPEIIGRAIMEVR